MLANGRGVICKFNDPLSLADGVTELLDERLRKIIQRRVYRYSRRFLWSNVARSYGDLFNTLIKNYGWIQTGLPADKTCFSQGTRGWHRFISTCKILNALQKRRIKD
jgi:hypothetical protein